MMTVLELVFHLSLPVLGFFSARAMPGTGFSAEIRIFNLPEMCGERFHSLPRLECMFSVQLFAYKASKGRETCFWKQSLITYLDVSDKKQAATESRSVQACLPSGKFARPVIFAV